MVAHHCVISRNVSRETRFDASRSGDSLHACMRHVDRHEEVCPSWLAAKLASRAVRSSATRRNTA
jgi:hypothetical protein